MNEIEESRVKGIIEWYSKVMEAISEDAKKNNITIFSAFYLRSGNDVNTLDTYTLWWFEWITWRDIGNIKYYVDNLLQWWS